MRTEPIRMMVVLPALVLALSGCHWLQREPSIGALTVKQHDEDQTVFATDFGTGIYRLDSKHSLTVVLWSGSEQEPTEAVTMRMFWRPAAGATPLDRTATNATVQYIVFDGAEAGGEIGIYSGAGFLYPKSDPGQRRLDAQIWQATLQLSVWSEGYEQRLVRGELSGRFTAARDDAAVSEAIRRLNVQVSERLGYPRLVRAD